MRMHISRRFTGLCMKASPRGSQSRHQSVVKDRSSLGYITRGRLDPRSLTPPVAAASTRHEASRARLGAPAGHKGVERSSFLLRLGPEAPEACLSGDRGG
jgi:hypothetical protein